MPKKVDRFDDALSNVPKPAEPKTRENTGAGQGTVRLTLDLDKATKKRLARFALENETNQSDVLRHALAYYLDAHEKH